MAVKKEATEPRVPIGWVEVITLKVLRSSRWLGKPLRKMCVTNEHDYGLHIVSTSWSVLHSILITEFILRVTRWVPLVEQDLLTLPEHLSSPFVIGWVRVARSVAVCVTLSKSLFFVVFPLAIVSSVFLLLTDSCYLFDISKLFLIMIFIQYTSYIFSFCSYL